MRIGGRTSPTARPTNPSDAYSLFSPSLVEGPSPNCSCGMHCTHRPTMRKMDKSFKPKKWIHDSQGSRIGCWRAREPECAEHRVLLSICWPRKRQTCAYCSGSVHHNRNSKLVMSSVNIDVQELSVQFARTGCGTWAERRRTVKGWRASSSLIMSSRYAGRINVEQYTLARRIDGLCVAEQPG
ncbi:hypothetical protein PILCRDRAFT_500374 [Piloderma croceum F 1598]|uniref:Uncharacterized protein n=1 Tax=Piloderma croceum (strain F 1598) TaxID=765440 RepID=A0A0C3BVJ3_PILCF|nr:hypothetical protein PILCRDRAFT_500374 [Piloderma croceum F 1598]